MKNIYDFLTHIKNNYSGKIAFEWTNYSDKTVCSKTYDDVYEDVGFFMSFYNRKEDFKNKNIGLIASNSYNYVITIIGIIALGGTVIPINYFESEEEISKRIIESNISHIFYDRKFNTKIITTNGIKFLSLNEYESQKELLDVPFVDNYDEKTIAMIHTSGTTGKTKCAMISFKNLKAACIAAKSEIDDMERKYQNPIRKIIVMLPFYHAFGFSDIFQFLYIGLANVLCCDLGKLSIDLEQHNCDGAVVVPIVLDKWAKDFELGKKNVLGKINTILYGGSFLSKKSTNIFLKNKINLVRAYGMSETTAVGTYCLVDENTSDNEIGKPVEGMCVKIIEDEICFSGDAVIDGYYKTTEKVKIDGWLHSGDLGYIINDNIFISGRKKNLIILSSGENVSPEELENELIKNKLIIEVIVKELDNKICAEIYCEKGNQEKIRQYVADVNKTLPLYKHINKIIFRNECFEKTTTGKIIRK